MNQNGIFKEHITESIVGSVVILLTYLLTHVMNDKFGNHVKYKLFI